MKIAVMGRKPNEDFIFKAAALIRELDKNGAALSYGSVFVSRMAEAGITLPAGEVFTCAREIPSGTDLILTLGGDGTILSALPFAIESGIPVAGVNFGRLGFLTSFEPSSDFAALAGAILFRRYTLQRRELLDFSVVGLKDDFLPLALNEFSIQRSTGSGILSISLSIDGRPLPTFRADGILVATPTGSTAYSLSLGGPIILPGTGAMIITPIAPHNLNVRPLVVPSSSRIDISATAKKGSIVAAADNRQMLLGPLCLASVTTSASTLALAASSDNNFIGALGTKLHWGDDIRNNT